MESRRGGGGGKRGAPPHRGDQKRVRGREMKHRSKSNMTQLDGGEGQWRRREGCGPSPKEDEGEICSPIQRSDGSE